MSKVTTDRNLKMMINKCDDYAVKAVFTALLVIIRKQEAEIELLKAAILKKNKTVKRKGTKKS